MSTRLQRLCVDVEIAVHEAMPAHPERIRDLAPESQDTFDDIAMDVLDQRLFHLLTRTGWAR